MLVFHNELYNQLYSLDPKKKKKKTKKKQTTLVVFLLGLYYIYKLSTDIFMVLILPLHVCVSTWLNLILYLPGVFHIFPQIDFGHLLSYA